MITVNLLRHSLTKTCSNCREIFPATRDYFHYSKVGKYHLRNICIDCRSLEGSKYWKEKGKSHFQFVDGQRTYIPVNRIPKIESLHDQVVDLLVKTKLTQEQIGTQLGVSAMVIHQIKTKADIHRPSLRLRSHCERKCLWCGTEYRHSVSGTRPNRGKFCSRECYNQWQKSEANRGSNHPNWKEDSEHDPNKGITKSEEWRTWRQQVYIRDNFTCQECGERGGKLHPHHILRKRRYPQLVFEIKNGITLCSPCHMRITHKEDEYIEKYSRYTGLETGKYSS